MRHIQQEHREWLKTMYPNQPSNVPAAGLVEEAGELLHAVLKLYQSELWGLEYRHGDLHTKFVDAVGDCAIYACSYCNSVGWDFESTVEAATVPHSGLSVTLAVALVKKSAEFFEDRKRLDLVRYIELLMSLCRANDVSFCDAVTSTWEQVKRRTR